MIAPLAPERLARRCDPAGFAFTTTADLPPLDTVVGQARAVEAADFGIGIRSPGFNLYAMGPEGIGKHTLIRQFLAARAPGEALPSDWCYLHNFADPRRPVSLRLPAGKGRAFRDRIDRLNRELRSAIPAAFESDEYRARKSALEDAFKERRNAALVGFERKAAARGVALLRTPIGVGLAALRDGKVLESEELEQLPEEERTRILAAMHALEAELSELVQRTFPRWEREARAAVQAASEEVTKRAAGHLIDEVRRAWADEPAVLAHLEALERDVVANAEEFLAAAGPRELPALLAARLEDGAVFRRYGVNLLVDHGEGVGAPVVYEDLPTQPNLLGRVEHAAQFGALVTDFSLVRAGALHRANGGYLVLDARRLLSQPFAWEELKRALRSREIRIESPGERLGIVSTVSLEPEPIPLDLKVVLVGDRLVYYLLADLDPDFLELFKVQVDFGEDVPRSAETETELVSLLGTVAVREGLRPLEPGAAAALVEHASRLAGDAERLSTHMRRLTDVLREADDRAARVEHPVIAAADVTEAVDARRRRASRLHDLQLELIERGTILVATDGEATGVANGLSVVLLGEEAFGRPSRITARVRLGDGEVVDIEREVQLGGPIHSKGVLILAGFLGGRYGRRRPLSLGASLVFEQSYGGVEGDSATLAETCALLSAIGEVPLRQGVAITGSLNQQGDVQPVGGVNEKVEGFFDVCVGRGLTGTQGVIVPAANAPNLMLRADVVAASAAGRFAVWPVATVDEALEVLTGIPAGTRDRRGRWTPGSVNARVEAGLEALAEHAFEALGRALEARETLGAAGRRRDGHRDPVPKTPPEPEKPPKPPKPVPPAPRKR
jgi:lon-related putative ATP-dependent protease